MRTGAKILMIIVFFIVGMFFITLIKVGQGRGNAPGLGGPLGIIIMFAMLAGIRAIWKYRPESKNDESGAGHDLDKS